MIPKAEKGGRKRRDSVLEMRFMYHLRRLRKDAKMTQRELAEAIDLENGSSISMLETGIRGASQETIQLLAQYFGVDPSEFYAPPSRVAKKKPSRLA